ncbi:MAG: MoaD/ThiS family protein [Candidatus Eremiobacteraeota bacterium]|nr:MoaD/ThiS family protein [Candidatus Eremiobacteraeota bacterium]
MQISVLAFARIRELLGFSRKSIQMPDCSTIGAAWSIYEAENSELALLAPSTRFALNGKIANPEAMLHDGDELAFFPPVGGG